MQFIRKSKYHSVSKEGYTVSASFNGKFWQFTAWQGAKNLLDVFKKSESAYECCSDHYREKNK